MLGFSRLGNFLFLGLVDFLLGCQEGAGAKISIMEYPETGRIWTRFFAIYFMFLSCVYTYIYSFDWLTIIVRYSSFLILEPLKLTLSNMECS